MNRAPEPLIVATVFDEETHTRLDGLRRRYFPPERNRLAAHLTLFHALPGDAVDEVVEVLREASVPVHARVTGVRSLGRGAALVVDSPDLSGLRARVAGAFAGRLTRQDAQGFRPHVTVQNFVDPAVARATVEALSEGFEPWTLGIVGLAVHRYRGGPWEHLATVPATHS